MGFCPEKGSGFETRGGVKLLARKTAKLWTERIGVQEVWAVLIVNIDGAEVWTVTMGHSFAGGYYLQYI